MLSNKEITTLIFGLKIKYLRTSKNLSYQQLHEMTGIALSYIHDIEKGKKTPKPDKIFALAKALGVEYDDLVSLKANKRLRPMITLLRSDFIKIFPFDIFGLDVGKLMTLFFQTPDKVNAFVSTIIKMVRSHQMGLEYFYQASLRSYQDLYDNYFEDIEVSVREFKETFNVEKTSGFEPIFLESLLQKHYGIEVNKEKLSLHTKLNSIRSFFKKEKKVFYINKTLSEAQQNFLLGRELAFQYLQIKERPYETRILKATTFELLLNNFRASYFSAALLMDEIELTNDVKAFLQLNTWQPEKLSSLLTKYKVTPEMLFQRFTNILPKHLNINEVFFLRLKSESNLRTFQITKELHLSQLHEPYANQKDEKYCRRWVSIDVLKKHRLLKSAENMHFADAQISDYWQTPNAYLCLSIAQKEHEDSKERNSVTVGLMVNEELRKLVGFLRDPNLITRTVNTTCERCSMPDCSERAASPIVIEEAEQIEGLLEALKEL
ncbi:MAG: helix-turn-helix domain-containing protein [Chitinophagales bacterium]